MLLCNRLGLTAAVFSLMLLFNSPAAKASSYGIDWAPSYQVAASQAAASNKLIFIDFYTTWCHWCTKLDTDIYPDANVVAEMQKFSCVKLDAERDGKALAKQFSVDGYPTIIVLDEDGNVVDRIACGFNDADNFLRVVTGFEKEAADYPVLLEKLKSAPDTLTREDYLSLAPMLINHSQFVDTAIVLDKLRGFGEHDALGPLYNQLGDADMTAKRVIQARDAYTKTIGFTRDPDILYHAHLALANSYLATHENSSAVPHLQALLSFPKTSEPLKDQIQYTLRKIQGN